MVPGRDTVYQEGDLVHVVLRADDTPTAESALSAPPPAGDH